MPEITDDQERLIMIDSSNKLKLKSAYADWVKREVLTFLIEFYLRNCQYVKVGKEFYIADKWIHEWLDGPHFEGVLAELASFEAAMDNYKENYQ